MAPFDKDDLDRVMIRTGAALMEHIRGNESLDAAAAIQMLRAFESWMVQQQEQTTHKQLPATITCPQCWMTSHHPADVAAGYCGNCHWWTSAPVLCDVQIVPGYPHHGGPERLLGSE